MITEIGFRFGSLPQSRGLSLEPPAITLFVGPNNSGKSLILHEIESAFQGGQATTDGKILEFIKFREYTVDEATVALNSIVVPRMPGETEHLGHVYASISGERFLVSTEQFIRGLSGLATSTPNSSLAGMVGRSYLRFQVRRLGGEGRITLANDQAMGDLQSSSISAFQQLFRDDPARTRIRAMVHGALQRHLVIDPTGGGGLLRLRLSAREPADCNEEQGLTQVSTRFHGEALLVASQSDGIKAFIGLLIEIMAGRAETYLLDEPEAFLHPSLAFTLGRDIAKTLKTSGKQIFASTHSAQFLMGCVQSGAPVDVVRLTYREGVATARRLPSTVLAKLARNPLLRSANVLAGLFYENVVVCEADTDRAFYQEINERLLSLDPRRGIPNCLFLNANGKDTIPPICSLLRSLGIPTAMIFDIDYVKDGGSKATSRLRAAGIPDELHHTFSLARKEAKKALDQTGEDYKTQGGIDLLIGSSRQTAATTFETLERFGTFVVPIGEVESWLPQLNCQGHGPEWLTSIFSRMGEVETNENYTRPSGGDVWEFIGRIKDWLLDPNRSGIPE